jgi:hypothetical protein
MNKNLKNFLTAILTSILAYTADAGRSQLKEYANLNFNFTPGILYLVLVNIIFVGILIYIFTLIRKEPPSQTVNVLLLGLGFILLSLPFLHFANLSRIILPAESLQVTYTNLIGSSWFIFDLLGLFGWNNKKEIAKTT